MSTDISEVRAAFIIDLTMEAAHTSETSVDIDFTTQQYIPEDSELHTRRRWEPKISRQKGGQRKLNPHVAGILVRFSFLSTCLKR
jgi:hypothetical protein